VHRPSRGTALSGGLTAEGDKAPDFSLQADDGTTVTLESLEGRNVVLFFYPKDDTPGCTKEACGFRDAFPGFGKMDAEVLGVSPDSVQSHRKFKQKYQLPFRLLADEGHHLADAFGVWKQKSMYGLKFMGIERTTVIIDRKGRVARIFPKVKVPGHVEEVEKAVRDLA
jgi:peroxiredoxin Q/BCP